MKNKNEKIIIEKLVRIEKLTLELTRQLLTQTDDNQPFDWDDPSTALTIKEARDVLNASRNKVDGMRKQGTLTSYYRGKFVRLCRREVEGARKTWSVMKGKV